MISNVALDTTSEAKLTPKIAGDSVFLDRQECAQLGESLHDIYVNNEPFPHIVLDNFFPIECLQRVVNEFPERETPRFADAQSQLKTGYQMEAIQSPYITNFLSALNSSQFLEFLQKLTGIDGLIPDPHFFGGGLHETARGGFLSIHADFNILKSLNLRRRMNLILFLNENWEDSYGGHLELWSKDMKECRASVPPEIGKAVIFNTEQDSFHGHPDPTTSPDGAYRRSIALYYYTAADITMVEQAKTTQFKARPGSSDQKQPMGVRVREIAHDFLPPILNRKIFKGKL